MLPNSDAFLIDGVCQPVAITGPQWMAYAVEASEKIAGVGLRMVAQFVRDVGRWGVSMCMSKLVPMP